MKMQPFDAPNTDLLTVRNFVTMAKKTFLVDDDGHGYYGTPDQYDLEAPARPSEALKGDVFNNGYGYVHWFNK